MQGVNAARPPFYFLPLTYSLQSVGTSKTMYDLYCVHCGFKVCKATDPVVVVSDGEISKSGTQVLCKTHGCRQRINIEIRG